MLIAQTRSTNPISSILLISFFWLLNLGLSFFESLLSYSNLTNLPLLEILLANLAILGISILLNRILQENKLVGVGDVFSGILFLIFMLGIKDIHQYFKELMSLFLITLGNNRLISLHNNNKNYLREFEVGILFGLSVVIDPCLFLMPIVIFIGIRLAIPFTWRDFIIPLMGFFCVFFIKDTLLFVLNRWTFISLPDFSLAFPRLDIPLGFSSVLIVLLLLFDFLVFYKVVTVLQKRSIKHRVFYWLWIWTLFFLFLSLILLNEYCEKSFLILALGLPCSVFGTEFFPKKRKLKEYWKKEILIYLLVLVLLLLRIY